MTKIIAASYLILFLLTATVTSLVAQRSLPLIQATSKSVDIREMGVRFKNRWTIVPEAKPDVYITHVRNGKVTFYTNRDSITFTVVPGATYDFNILLNDKDTAFTRIQYEPSKLDILKGAAAYNVKDRRTIPTFTYQDKQDTNLVALRKGLHLDSIAGTGTETLKILNLLHWIHNLIPHDGQHENPVVKNAMSLVKTCKAEARGLNCRGLATVLNECYLALGIKSRFATCMPKDSVFDDCHVINLVYSSKRQKWIWIDPTNNAYVMDENGQLLSIEEVRERLVNNRPLILNPDANWNNRSTATKDDYLKQYMAKNLYRIECPVESQYDYETWQQGKQVAYVELLPLDGYNQMPQTTRQTNPKTGTTFTRYKTNNPSLFWAKPE
jgi:hypothetical protein